MKDVSKKTGISLSSLCQLNGLGRNDSLKPGQRIKLTQANLPVKPSFGSASCSVKDSGKKPAAAKRDKPNSKSSKHGEAKAAHKPAAKSAASQESSAAKKHAAKKPAVKQTGKSGKPASKTVTKKTPDSKGKVKTAAKSGKNTTLAKK